MKIKQVIADLYERFMHGSIFKIAEVGQQTLVEALYHLLRLYLLNLY